MNFFSSLHKPHKKLFNNLYFSLFTIIAFYFLVGCSSTKRFADGNEINENIESNLIRVLLDDQSYNLSIDVYSQIFVYNSGKILAKIKSGNKLLFKANNNSLTLSISDKEFESDTFLIKSADEDSIIRVDNKKFRGSLKIFSDGSQIKVVNQIGLEDYIKGVITKEMPIGKGNDNNEALKAFSICVRTYAITKIAEGKLVFDTYPDTRDQVYGGVDAENSKTNAIVNETRGLILSYDNSPAIIFYHACCGGYTEDVKNVFSNNDLPYLRSIKDGDQPYCSIAPKFNWTEEYPEDLFISRLFDAQFIKSKNYKIKDISIISRFKSGRVNQLDIEVAGSNNAEKTISIFGNKIRNIIRTADGKSILRSTMFDIFLKDNYIVVINGKGFGHGVGLCQWGAIGQSREGIDYLSILNHYFPGTEVIKYHD